MNKSCENCKKFKNEDISGYGFCDVKERYISHYEICREWETRKSINALASESCGRSRSCKECKFRTNQEVCKVCFRAFKEGFAKGYKKGKTLIK